LDRERQNKQTNPETPRAGSASARARVRRFWFEHEGREIELGAGVVFMGRSSSCHIIVDDGLASRRHAKIEVLSDGVNVEDCGSVNGVYVNARRISGQLRIKDGDHVQIGRQDFVLRSMLVSDSPDPERERERERDSLAATRIDDSRGFPPQMVSENEATFSGDTLDLLGGVAEKILALGRGDEAERILSAPLVSLLGELKAGRRAQAGSDIIDKAGRYAVKLADATAKGRWIDYVIELYAVARRPMPGTVVDQLYVILRKASSINLGALREYLGTLRESAQSFGPAERFVVQRLEGLERLAASK
jgi:pSer/pThr/pTyr-binding forkhead associated (FHA) protein